MTMAQTDRVVLMLDIGEMDRALAAAGLELGLRELAEYLVGGRRLVDAYAYIPADRELDDEETTALRATGCLLRETCPDGRAQGGNASVLLTLDALHLAANHRPDTIVLASNDGALMPLVERLRLQGLRVEVAAVARLAPRPLQLVASGLIDLEQIARPCEHLRLNEVESES